MYRYKNNIFIHKYYDGGFSENTDIKLINDITKHIKDIEINDILENGSRVIGVVEILNKHLDNKMIKLNVNNTEFYAHQHLKLKHLGKWTNVKNITKERAVSKKNTKLFHLITSNGIIPIGNMLFKDYDNILDSHL